MAPWVNFVLLIVMFAMVENRMVVQPGTVVELPRAPFKEGAGGGMVAVLYSVEGRKGEPREEVLFFDDERFLVRRSEEMKRFQRVLAEARRLNKGKDLILQADKNIPHGTIAELMNVAREVGVHRVVTATRPY